MLTWETTVEAQALYARGWTKSAIARHLGINRRTVREYLKGQQVPGQRVRSEPEVFAPFAEYALGEAIRAFHIDASPAPSHSTWISTVALSVLAHTVCAALRRRLPGYQ